MPWAVLVAALAQSAGGSAPAPTAPLAKGADLALLEVVRAVATRVETLRGQAFSRPPVAVRAPDDLRDAAIEIRAWGDVDRQRLEARGRAWADLGLGGPASPAALRRLLATDVAGMVLDPAAARLLVAPDRLLDVIVEEGATPSLDSSLRRATGVHPDETVASHVLMHLRQRERDGRACSAETTDGLLARAAGCEGEANLVAIRHLFAALGVGAEALAHTVEPGEFLDGALVPAGLADMHGAEADLARFVYDEGFVRSVSRFRAGGWDGVEQALSRTRTTRDLLHPERPALAPESGSAPVPPRPGLRLRDEDSLGEQGIVALVSRVTGKDDLALQAGDGWLGDRLLRWEAEGGLPGGVTEWTTRWASEDDVEDFHYAFLRALGVRFREAAVEAESPQVRTLRAPDRVIRIERSPGAVRVLLASPEFAPPPAAPPAPAAAPKVPRKGAG